MKKSNSLQHYPLEFDLKATKIGSSKIQRLPVRPDARRNTLSYLLAAEEKLQLQKLQNQNTMLRKENQNLRKKIQNLINKPIISSIKKPKDYNQILRQPISKHQENMPFSKHNSKFKNSRVTTQCQTGLFSSKQVSFEESVSISSWYNKYILTKKQIQLDDIQQALQIFCQQYLDNYTKLKNLVCCFSVDQNNQKYKKITSIVELYKIPLEYQKSPKVLFNSLNKIRELSKQSKQKQTKSSSNPPLPRQSSKGKQFCWQVLSPTQAAMKIQHTLLKMCRNDLIVKLLKNSDNFIKIVRKIVSK